MDNIIVSAGPMVSPQNADTEICEHKGVGHPDSLCDGAVEAAARELGRVYLEDYGAVQHFNLDKALLVGGLSEPRFGGGRVTRSMKLLISGPATPLRSQSAEAIVQRAVSEYFVRTLGLGANLIDVVPMLRAGALNLRSVNRPTGVPQANDTSFGVGYAPFSRLEQTVLTAADVLRSGNLRKTYPALGLDYKIMGHRIGERMQLTLAVALIDRYVTGVADYFAQKFHISREINDRLEGGCTLLCNTLDDRNAPDESGLYLTVTGLSAEQGDDGEVGRGNRVNGLITPCRPMSLEAVAGKNPAGHVGKLYNVLAHQLARQILDETAGATHVTVYLLSAIGSPIDKPQLAAVNVCMPDGLSSAQRGVIQERVAHGLSELPMLTLQLIDGTTRVG